MEIRLAAAKDKKQILKYDCHIHHNKVGECIYNGLVDFRYKVSAKSRPERSLKSMIVREVVTS